jgi:hypothetical protein
MRTRLAAVLLLAAVSASASNLPLRVSFQGKLVDPATNLPKNGSFDMTFKLYSVPTGGTALYTETQTGVTVSNGVFAVELGSTAVLSPDLFSGASVYLGVTVSPDAEMTPRQHLVMAPYAFTAAQLVSDGPARVEVGASYSTFTAAGDLDLAGGLSAKTASLTATGAGVYSLTASSGASVGGDLSVAGESYVGLYYRNLNENNANCRVACTTAGTALVGGGCYETATNQLRRSFPSSENTDAAAIGTPVVDGASAAYSWTCVYSGSNAGNRCFAICARLQN